MRKAISLGELVGFGRHRAHADKSYMPSRWCVIWFARLHSMLL